MASRTKASATAPGEEKASGRRAARTQRVYWPAIVACLAGVAVIGGLAVLPARTWSAQRASTNEANDRHRQLEGRIAELEAQLSLLETDAEIERMARENFDLVFPGEESYRILPAPEQASDES